MKTIAQQLKITKFPFEIKDDEGNQIYYEDSDGFWYKQEFDEKGNRIYHENSNGFWHKDEGNRIYCEYPNGFWYKRTYDEKGNEIYCETSDGKVIDNRPKCENKVVAQQTVVEWLQKQIKLSAFVDRTQGFTYLDTEILFEMLAKANQMHKEQIVKAYSNGSPEFFDMAKEYYNETFTSTPQGESPSAIETGQS